MISPRLFVTMPEIHRHHDGTLRQQLAQLLPYLLTLTKQLLIRHLLLLSRARHGYRPHAHSISHPYYKEIRLCYCL